MRIALKKSLVILACLSVCQATATTSADITWYLVNPRSIPIDKLNAITAAMDDAVAAYNFYADYDRELRVGYTSDPNVTANGNFNGNINFGTKINDWTAMHEISHVLGVGTYWTWDNFLAPGNRWTGANGLAELEAIDGPGSILHADGLHFWPYGNNTAPDDDQSHVRMVGALRADMGLSNDTIPMSGLAGDYNNDSIVDAADYTVWRNNLQTGEPMYNDVTPGATDAGDYAWWKRFYGRTSSAGSAATQVPEPHSIAVAFALVALMACPRLLAVASRSE